MAAKAFTHSEWKKIWESLEADPGRYGLPDRVYGSVLLASFNIRKLGSATSRNNDTWKFLAHVCRRFDLLPCRPTFLTFIRTPFCVNFEDETFDQIGLSCREQHSSSAMSARWTPRYQEDHRKEQRTHAL